MVAEQPPGGWTGPGEAEEAVGKGGKGVAEAEGGVEAGAVH